MASVVEAWAMPAMSSERIRVVARRMARLRAFGIDLLSLRTDWRRVAIKDSVHAERSLRQQAKSKRRRGWPFDFGPAGLRSGRTVVVFRDSALIRSCGRGMMDVTSLHWHVVQRVRCGFGREGVVPPLQRVVPEPLAFHRRAQAMAVGKLGGADAGCVGMGTHAEPVEAGAHVQRRAMRAVGGAALHGEIHGGAAAVAGDG